LQPAVLVAHQILVETQVEEAVMAVLVQAEVVAAAQMEPHQWLELVAMADLAPS